MAATLAICGKSSEAVSNQRSLTVRFPPAIHQLVQQEAAAEGVSLSEFIREGAIMRALWAQAQRGELDPAVEAIAHALEQRRQ